MIALSDQDDVWHRDKLRLIEETFIKAPQAGLVFSDAEIVDVNLSPLGRRMWDEVNFDAHKKKLVRLGRAIDVLITGWTVTGATMAFRSQFVKLALPVPEDIAMIHDGWIALAVGSVSDVAIIEQPLIKYRQHEQQQIGAPMRTRLKQVDGCRRLRKHFAVATQVLTCTIHSLRWRNGLTAHRSTFDTRNALSFIANYSLHLNVRANLPQRRLNRVPSILRELLTLRYHEYANGFKSAAKDLVS